MATLDPQPFDMTAVKPFYPANDETKLANVGLRLDNERRAARRQSRRITRMLDRTKAATEALGEMPAEGESVHIVLSGKFALADFIGAALRLSDEPISELWIATLGFSRKNVEGLAQLVDAGQIKRLDVLCSHYFAAQDTEIFDHMAELCGQHGFRLAAMRTHAKVLLIRTGPHRLVVESSANLRSCHNVEQATVFNDAGLYDFHRGWIDQLLTEGAKA